MFRYETSYFFQTADSNFTQINEVLQVEVEWYFLTFAIQKQ